MDSKNSIEPITVNLSVLSQMILYLRSLKVDVDVFLNSIGVDAQILDSPETYIPIETYLFIQDSAAEYTHDDYFGLHMGEYAEAGSWSILGYLMMNCRNLGEAMEKTGRYSRIIGNLIESTPHLYFNKLKLVFNTPPHTPSMSRHCYESTLSSLVRMVRSLTGRHLCPHEVTFIYPVPDATDEYSRIFGCPVHFNRKENSLTVDLSLGNTPILMANDELKDYFEAYARDFLSKLDHQTDCTQSVTRILLAHMDDESLTINKVAKEMSLSVRGLQKRLGAEGVVFSDLLQEIREKLARQYLKENYTVEQITYMLGFSEPSVFRKAFKKWSGVTPGEFREQYGISHRQSLTW